MGKPFPGEQPQARCLASRLGSVICNGGILRGARAFPQIRTRHWSCCARLLEPVSGFTPSSQTTVDKKGLKDSEDTRGRAYSRR